METQQLTAAIFTRLKRRIFLILGAAVICSLVLIIYSLRTPKTYTSTATIFPLTAGSDNGSGSSVLSALMGGGDIGKGFTDENSVNIIELAQSRTTREEVAKTRVPAMQNKMIAQLILEDFNRNKSLLEKNIEIKPDDPYLVNWASSVFKANLDASITKTSSFVLNYTGRSPELVSVVSYAFIDKISAFYIELKREKAKRDFEFASMKVDSLRSVMGTKDQKLIDMDRKTLFTNTLKLQYRVPTENVLADKQMLRAQYANAIANQQNAAYKLQKATPVIRVLDKPDAPYTVSKKSPITFGIIGFVLGFLGLSFLIAAPMLIGFAGGEFSKMIYGPQKKS